MIYNKCNRAILNQHNVNRAFYRVAAALGTDAAIAGYKQNNKVADNNLFFSHMYRLYNLNNIIRNVLITFPAISYVVITDADAERDIKLARRIEFANGILLDNDICYLDKQADALLWGTFCIACDFTFIRLIRLYGHNDGYVPDMSIDDIINKNYRLYR